MKSVIALALAVAVSAPAFARTMHNQQRDSASGLRAYNYAPQPTPQATQPSDPMNNPTMSGGGSMGYNKYMGHAH
jgi:hypothetical protein